jgi:hypothetical protein
MSCKGKSSCAPTRALTDAAQWGHVTLDAAKGETLDRELLMMVMQGEVSAVRLKNFLRPSEVSAVLENLSTHLRGAREYSGTASNLTAFPLPSHWEFRYQVDGNWNDYFSRVAAADELRREVFFSALGEDPLERVADLLAQAWPGRVKRARHPKWGRPMYVGVLRSGCPKLHFDWARYDFEPPLDAAMQAGWSVHLRKGGAVGGELKMYRTYGVAPGNTVTSGRQPVGNYDLPRSLVDGVQSNVVPCEPGDWVLAANRLLHEVLPADRCEERLAFAGHVAWMRNGELWQFS